MAPDAEQGQPRCVFDLPPLKCFGTGFRLHMAQRCHQRALQLQESLLRQRLRHCQEGMPISGQWEAKLCGVHDVLQ